jgi:hypothetical protein
VPLHRVCARRLRGVLTSNLLGLDKIFVGMAAPLSLPMVDPLNLDLRADRDIWKGKPDHLDGRRRSGTGRRLFLKVQDQIFAAPPSLLKFDRSHQTTDHHLATVISTGVVDQLMHRRAKRRLPGTSVYNKPSTADTCRKRRQEESLPPTACLLIQWVHTATHGYTRMR